MPIEVLLVGCANPKGLWERSPSTGAVATSDVHHQGKPTKEWITVLKAADAAARWHVQQKRKGAAQEPYINHLLKVAYLADNATSGKDLNLVVAAPKVA